MPNERRYYSEQIYNPHRRNPYNVVDAKTGKSIATVGTRELADALALAMDEALSGRTSPVELIAMFALCGVAAAEALNERPLVTDR